MGNTRGQSDEAAGKGASDPAQDEPTVTVDSTVTSVTSVSQEGPHETEGALERGSSVGRYVVYEVLGVGGMGIVYKAYDPDLDRGVALKVLAVKSRGDVEATNARARLEREARALAQLSHPNVVAVHDVGRVEGDLFIAMELVEGQTLKEWRKGASRSRKEIVDTFCAAGRGLAAAHRAGLIHRDFKPSNVLIGDDGRVRVADFGLARSAEPEVSASSQKSASISRDEESIDPDENTSSQENTSSSLWAGSLVGAPLTRVGAIMGTPQYMAPEQFRGEAVDAATDQFSFCVALYEALYGARPFRSKDFVGLRRRVLAGRLSSPPTDARVPGWLRKIVVRGLAVAPEDRYPSMDALLADLQRDPAVARRRALTVVGAMALTGLAIIGFGRVSEPVQLCQGARAELVGRWDSAARAAVQKAFLATKLPYAKDMYRRVEKELDRYSDAWVSMRTNACEATHVHGTQSEHMLDLRMHCLDSRLVGLEALSSLLAKEADAATLEKAMTATLALPTLDRCADDQALTAAIPPPEDEKTRRRVDDLRRRLADARALETTGRYRDGLDKLVGVSEEVDAISYEPLHAEMHLLFGLLHLGAGEFKAAAKSLRQAVVDGAHAKDDALVAEAWTQLIRALAEDAEYDLALEMILGTKVAVARAGDTALQRGLLEWQVGGVHHKKGDYEVAIKHQKAAVELTESALGESHPTVATCINSLANTYYVQGKYAEARGYYERALAIREETLGSEHPLVGALVFNLGMMAASEPDYERSEMMLGRALRLFQGAYGDEHPHTAAAYATLGVALHVSGHYREGEPLLRRSIVLREKVVGADHPDTVASIIDLGMLLIDAERYEEAEQLLRRGIQLWEAKLGAGYPKLGYVFSGLADTESLRGNFAAAQPHYEHAIELQVASFDHQSVYLARTRSRYGWALVRAGRLPAAREQFEKSLAIYEKVVSADHPSLTEPLTGLGVYHLSIGQTEQAMPFLERALAIRQRYPRLDTYETAKIEVELSRALWADVDARPRAMSLATEARAVFKEDSRPSARAQLARVDAWLRNPRSVAVRSAQAR